MESLENESVQVYGYRKLHDDHLDMGQTCSPTRGAHLAGLASIRYTCRPGLGSFLKAHNLKHSMSQHGNCHDNAVAENFFKLLKRERIWRGVYNSCVEARQGVFGYIGLFYNPQREQAKNGMLSPVEFERQRRMRAEDI